LSPIDHDAHAGLIRDGAIRYVLMRPDVLMNVGRFLPEAGRDGYLAALERAFATHAEASFQQYRAAGAVDLDALLERSRLAAGTLGWGRWTLLPAAAGAREVVVVDSPFTAASGPADRPVCAPIRGVLRAIATTAGREGVEVREICCAAQGAADCRFALTWR
jgi:predicted hydrocarbon binding protein